jgi:hypothetical protein
MTPEQGQRIHAGGVVFHVEYRTFGGDRGPAIRVLGDVDGREVQLLRFDCFDKDPHYHYDPDGKDFHLHLSRETVPDPVAWAVGELRRNLRVMIRAAGYPSVAERLDREAASAAADRVMAAIRTAQATFASLPA